MCALADQGEGTVNRNLQSSTRKELTEAVRQRYSAATKGEKAKILDEFIQITGYHRKSAIRILNGKIGAERSRKAKPRIYDEAVRSALTVLWEASDRVCGKRLHALLPVLIPALERNGHLSLDGTIKEKLENISASSIDRLLREIRSPASQPRRKRTPAVSKAVPVRTFADWGEPEPGYFEMDLVAHCGDHMGGSFIHTLTLTDIASGWTECRPVLVREATVITACLDDVRLTLPFAMQGLDVDNGTEFLNKTLSEYCQNHGLEFTRSRPYHKNDQAWVEQKNGSVVRRLVGYRRLEGIQAAETLMRLYQASRLFVNFFQPSFKLKEKVRVGGQVRKHYHSPQTPAARLLACDSVAPDLKRRVEALSTKIDPLELLDTIRSCQYRLAEIADQGNVEAGRGEKDPDLSAFLRSLASAWHNEEIRPTHASISQSPRHWRTRADPFADVWPEVGKWLVADPDQTGKQVFERLQAKYPGIFPDGQLRTLQRRLKKWRQSMAHQLVFGAEVAGPESANF